jgi:O-antigen/teichoic acid export membrane protein
MLEKLKQLSKDTAVYGISTMIGRFLNFLLVPFYTHVFLPAEYGIVILIYTIGALLNVVYIYGMDSAYLKYTGMGENSEEKDNFSTPFLSVLFTSLILSLLLLSSKSTLFNLLNIPSEYHYLGNYLAAFLFLDAVSVIPFISLRLKRKAKKFAALKVLNIIVNIALTLYLLLVVHMGIEAVFIANLIASLSSLLLLLPAIIKDLKIKFDFPRLKRFFKFGIPYLPAGIAAMVIQVIDRTILEHMTDMATVGIYAAGYKLGIFMMLFVNMFQFAWQPFFLQNAKEANAKEIFAKVLTYFTIIGSLILLILSLFIDNIISFSLFGRTLFNQNYWAGLPVVPIVLFAYLFNGMYVIFTAGIYIKEKSQYAPLITGLGAVTNVLVNLLLIPYYGMMGAAWATFASYFVLAAGMYLVTQKFYKIEYETAKILKILILIIISGIAYYSLLNNNLLNIYYKLAIIVGFLISLILLVIDKNELQFIRQKFLRK